MFLHSQLPSYKCLCSRVAFVEGKIAANRYIPIFMAYCSTKFCKPTIRRQKGNSRTNDIIFFVDLILERNKLLVVCQLRLGFYKKPTEAAKWKMSRKEATFIPFYSRTKEVLGCILYKTIKVTTSKYSVYLTTTYQSHHQFSRAHIRRL